MCRQNQEQTGEYWPEEPDYSDEYMYHTARRDHTRVFHQKKQYPQNILYKVDCNLDVHAITNLVLIVLKHFLHCAFSFCLLVLIFMVFHLPFNIELWFVSHRLLFSTLLIKIVCMLLCFRQHLVFSYCL